MRKYSVSICIVRQSGLRSCDSINIGVFIINEVFSLVDQPHNNIQSSLRGEAATNATVTINERPVWRIGQERLLPNMAAGQPPPEKSGGHTTCEYDCGSFHHSIKIYGKCPDPGWYKLKGGW